VRCIAISKCSPQDRKGSSAQCSFCRNNALVDYLGCVCMETHKTQILYIWKQNRTRQESIDLHHQALQLVPTHFLYCCCPWLEISSRGGAVNSGTAYGRGLDKQYDFKVHHVQLINSAKLNISKIHFQYLEFDSTFNIFNNIEFFNHLF
jgi:hypothetical protein